MEFGELSDFREALLFETGVWLLTFREQACPPEELGSLARDLTKKFRALGILALTLSGDTDRFYHDLIFSGRVWLDYLRRTKDIDLLDDHHRVAGRFEPLLDVIAAGDFALAKKIGDSAPRTWREGHEYEDDYCFGRLLHLLVSGGTDYDGATVLLERLERQTPLKKDPRLMVSRTLLNRDQPGFEEGIEATLVAFENKIQEDKERGQLEEHEILALRKICVEGLAYLRLAERFGLKTDEEYQYCPSIARMPMIEPCPNL